MYDYSGGNVFLSGNQTSQINNFCEMVDDPNRMIIVPVQE